MRIFLLIGTIAIASVAALAWQENQTLEDKNIHVQHYEELQYPPLAKTAAVQGIVVVRASLSAHGKVQDAMAISGNVMLIPASVANLKKWSFLPNPQNEAVVVYNFRLSPREPRTYKAFCRDLSHNSMVTFQAPNFVTIVPCPTLVDHAATSRQ